MYNNDDNGGCLGGILFIAAIVMIIQAIRALAPIFLGAGVVLLLIWSIRRLAKASEKRAREQKEKDARMRAEQEAEALRKEQERLERELAAFDEYLKAQTDPEIREKLRSANVILKKLSKEDDTFKREKILSFYDKYLPLITESIKAKEHGDVDLDESFETFTNAVEVFSKDLYNVDDIVEINQKLLEQLAIRDGFYDPFGASIFMDEQEKGKKESATMPPFGGEQKLQTWPPSGEENQPKASPRRETPEMPELVLEPSPAYDPGDAADMPDVPDMPELTLEPQDFASDPGEAAELTLEPAHDADPGEAPEMPEAAPEPQPAAFPKEAPEKKPVGLAPSARELKENAEELDRFIFGDDEKEEVPPEPVPEPIPEPEPKRPPEPRPFQKPDYDPNMVVNVVSVIFREGGLSYDYISDMNDIYVGDEVVVETHGGDATARVVSVTKQKVSQLILPLNKYKFIKGKIHRGLR